MIDLIKKEWKLLVLLLVTMIVAAVVYPYMPEQVPTHWNVKGEVDDYSGRAFGTFFIPVLNILLFVLFLVTPKIDPKRGNYQKFEGSYDLIRYATHLFMVFIFALTVSYSLGYETDISTWVPAGVAVLMIVIGNTMGKVRYNYFVGFKVPWTLSNEEVWRKTHQFGARAMVVGGIVALIVSFAAEGPLKMIFFLVAILGSNLITLIYSYVIYKKITS